MLSGNLFFRYLNIPRVLETFLLINLIWSAQSKPDDLFSHRKVMTFFSCSLLRTSTFRRRLSSVRSKFSHKNILVGCHPSPDGVTRGGPPPTHVAPLVTPLDFHCWDKVTPSPPTPYPPISLEVGFSCHGRPQDFFQGCAN